MGFFVTLWTNFLLTIFSSPLSTATLLDLKCSMSIYHFSDKDSIHHFCSCLSLSKNHTSFNPVDHQLQKLQNLKNAPSLLIPKPKINHLSTNPPATTYPSPYETAEADKQGKYAI